MKFKIHVPSDLTIPQPGIYAVHTLIEECQECIQKLLWKTAYHGRKKTTMTKTTETCFCFFLFFFLFCFFKRNICTCKFTAKLNHKGYLQIVTLLFRLPYVCLMIKFGSIRQRCVVHTACSLYIEKTAPIPCYKKKIVIAKKHFFFLLVSLIFSVYSSVLRTSTAHIFTIF